ncbi:MAG: two-component regulator propeller domain-containing protein [Planctomycetota bacterium]
MINAGFLFRQCRESFRNSPVPVLKMIGMGFLACLLLSQGTVLLGLDPAKTLNQYAVESWTMKNGLPVNGVESVFQDRQGYLWIGTQEGLLCFDGKRFDTFTKSNTPAMRSNLIHCINEDAEGRIWVGTNKGLLIIAGDSIQGLGMSDGLAHDCISDILPASDGTVWISTPGRGVNHFVDKRIDTFTTKDGMASDLVWCLAEGEDDTIWLGSLNGLICYKENRFTHYGTEEGLPNSDIRALHYGSDGVLWVGTQNGFNRFKQGSFTHYSVNEGLSSRGVCALAEDREGNLWIGTNGGGLNRMTQGEITSFSQDARPGGDLIRCLCEDREGCLWVASIGCGLFCFRDENFITYSAKDGLSSNDVKAVFEDRAGTLWIGTFGGGLNCFQNGVFTSLCKADGLSGDNVISLAEDHDGALWVGTYGAGITRLIDGGFDIIDNADGLACQYIRTIRQDRTGKVWIGTQRGLHCFDHGSMKHYTPEDGLMSMSIFSLLESRDGAMWVGTGGGGLYRFEEGVFTQYGPEQGLQDPTIYAIHEDEDDTLWIGTYEGGLHRLRDGRFSRVTSRDGLFDDKAYQILEDNQGNLWMSCNRGVYRISKKEFDLFVSGRISKVHCVSYGTSDGMRCSETNGGFQPAGIKTRDNRMWFPTLEGVVSVDPEHLLPDPGPPPALIERITLDYAPVPPADPVRVPAGTGRIEIQYTAISLKAPSSVRMKHKLEGYDKKWIEAGEDRKASYTLLPPGDYCFKVMAGNREGVWEALGASVAITMEARFYQTLYFYLLIVLLLACILMGFHHFRIKRLKNLKQLLACRVEEALALERRKELRYRSLFDNNLAGVAVTRMDGRIVDNNRAFAAILGFDSKEDLLGRNVMEFYGNQEDRKEMLAEIDACGTFVKYDCPARKKDGAPISVMMSVKQIPGEDGVKPVLESTVIDITEYKRAEARIKSSLKEKEVLLRELHHRTKNNMQVVCSLLTLQSYTHRDKDVQKMIKESIDRINSMALVHQKLYKSEDLSRIDFADYIRDLASTVLQSGSMDQEQIRIHFDLEPLDVLIDTAVPCGLILNELLSNSIKHAFPHARKGEVHVRLRRDEEGRIVLQVQDNGIGFPHDFDVDHLSSLGIRLISNLAEQQLQGEMQVLSQNGTSIEIRFKENISTAHPDPEEAGP